MKPKKEQLFYFDAEWVPVSEIPMNLQLDHPILYDAFIHQTEKWNNERIKEGLKKKSTEEWWDEKAHFYPEFCQIICISYGYFFNNEFVLKSVYGPDEKKLLTAILEVFNKVEKIGLFLCGYAIKRFDMPWISKRMMANGLTPPRSLCTYGKKPWEVDVFDLPEVWGQGVMGESFTPFELACAAVGLESSKDDLDGSKVAEAFFNGQIERIKIYCEKDVQKSMELASILIDRMP